MTEATSSWLAAAAGNLGLPSGEMLRRSLTQHALTINTSGHGRAVVTEKLLSPPEAKANADALAKETYKRLFDFVVGKVHGGG